VAHVRGYGEAQAMLLEERASREAFEAELKARTTAGGDTQTLNCILLTPNPEP